MLLYITINERNDINMNNRKYTVCRDNIYIGEVVRTRKSIVMKEKLIYFVPNQDN